VFFPVSAETVVGNRSDRTGFHRVDARGGQAWIEEIDFTEEPSGAESTEEHFALLGEAPNVHRGKQALGHMLEMLVASMDGGHPPTYASTLRIRQLASFLDKASHDILKRLTDQLVVGVSIGKASSGASSSGVASSKVVKKRVHRDVSMDAVNALVRNPVVKKAE
jgi:hypothetical protein